MKKLLIVESPAKAKTIGKYLGGDFTVKSSIGHIRDLPKKGGLAIKIEPVKGVDGEWTFKPTYEISPEKRNTSWSIWPKCRRREAILIFRMSMPSMRIWPFWMS